MDAFDDILTEENRLLMQARMDYMEWDTGGEFSKKYHMMQQQDCFERSLMVLLVVLLFALGIGALALGI